MAIASAPLTTVYHHVLSSVMNFATTVTVTRLRLPIWGEVYQGTGSNGRSIDLNKGGLTDYAASGSPYSFPAIDVDHHQ